MPFFEQASFLPPGKAESEMARIYATLESLLDQVPFPKRKIVDFWREVCDTKEVLLFMVTHLHNRCLLGGLPEHVLDNFAKKLIHALSRFSVESDNVLDVEMTLLERDFDRE